MIYYSRLITEKANPFPHGLSSIAIKTKQHRYRFDTWRLFWCWHPGWPWFFDLTLGKYFYINKDNYMDFIRHDFVTVYCRELGRLDWFPELFRSERPVCLRQYPSVTSTLSPTVSFLLLERSRGGSTISITILILSMIPPRWISTLGNTGFTSIMILRIISVKRFSACSRFRI